jgi:hypothetical protein
MNKKNSVETGCMTRVRVTFEYNITSLVEHEARSRGDNIPPAEVDLIAEYYALYDAGYSVSDDDPDIEAVTAVGKYYTSLSELVLDQGLELKYAEWAGDGSAPFEIEEQHAPHESTLLFLAALGWRYPKVWYTDGDAVFVEEPWALKDASIQTVRGDGIYTMSPAL